MKLHQGDLDVYTRGRLKFCDIVIEERGMTLK